MRLLPVSVLLSAACVCGQIVTFEVASVKPTRATVSIIAGGPGSATPDRITLTGMTLRSLLRFAHAESGTWLAEEQLEGPSFLNSERYDIVANVPAGASANSVRLMLQNLLAERFKIESHREMRPLETYELTVDQSGTNPWLVAAEEGNNSSADPPPFHPSEKDADGFVRLPPGSSMIVNGGSDGGRVVYTVGHSQEMSKIASWISRQTKLRVVDRTGLQGKFDFKIKFDAMSIPGTGMGAIYELRQQNQVRSTDTPVTPSNAPDLWSALRSQLGLKLEKKRSTVEMIVVDRASKMPIEN